MNNRMKHSLTIKRPSQTNQQKVIPMTKSTNLTQSPKIESPLSQNSCHSKDDYYIQISPRLETKQLTFVNQIKKLKITEPEDEKSQDELIHKLSPTDKQNNEHKQVLLHKSRFYVNCIRRLKTEQ